MTVHEGAATVAPVGRLKGENAQIFSQEKAPENRRVAGDPFVNFTGHRGFYQLLLDIADIHSRKNEDYANSAADPLRNFRECQNLGIAPFDGVLVRITDKYMRICNLREKERRDQTRSVQDEAITDTLMDLAVYSLIAILLYREMEQAGRPLPKQPDLEFISGVMDETDRLYMRDLIRSPSFREYLAKEILKHLDTGPRPSVPDPHQHEAEEVRPKRDC